jgi:hypothetical protein
VTPTRLRFGWKSRGDGWRDELLAILRDIARLRAAA